MPRPWWVCGLLLAQMHFLWVAALHNHQSLPSAPSASTLQASPLQAQPVVESALLCTACQIVRHAAARPAVVTPALQPGTTVLTRLAFVPSGYISHYSEVVYGRAPPLA